jgi:hypothetical protein
MSIRAYISNLHPRWPVDRQERSLSVGVPGWPKGIAVYRDELTPSQRKRRAVDELEGRIALLRQTTRGRKGGEDIYLASLAVLAWTLADLLECLTLAQSRGSTVHVLDTGLVLTPDAGPAALHQATKDFATGRKSSIAMAGGEVSGRLRSEAARLKAKEMEPFWRLPSEEYPTIPLLARFGLSRNTANLYLGKRPEVQRIHEAARKRRVRREIKNAE